MSEETEIYRAALKDGTLFKKIPKVRCDKGKPRRGRRLRTLRKIWKLILDLA